MKWPPSETRLLRNVADLFQTEVAENLVGIYVHGSLVMGCYNPESSDVDFLVVVKDKIDPSTKQKLIDGLIKSSEDAPPGGIEMSVITQKVLNPLQYPTPFELHFSKYWIEQYRDGKVDLRAEHSDPDLAAHMVVINNRGTVLVGQPIKDVFPAVPKSYYLAALAVDSRWSYDNIQKGSDSGECQVPTYAVLNFCRVLAYLHDDLVTSKAEGAEWAVKHLPAKYAPIIREASNEYQKMGSSKPIDAFLLREFASYSHSQVEHAAEATNQKWSYPKIVL